MTAYRVSPYIDDKNRPVFTIQRKGWFFWQIVDNGTSWMSETPYVFETWDAAEAQIHLLIETDRVNKIHMSNPKGAPIGGKKP